MERVQAVITLVVILNTPRIKKAMMETAARTSIKVKAAVFDGWEGYLLRFMVWEGRMILQHGFPVFNY